MVQPDRSDFARTFSRRYQALMTYVVSHLGKRCRRVRCRREALGAWLCDVGARFAHTDTFKLLRCEKHRTERAPADSTSEQARRCKTCRPTRMRATQPRSRRQHFSVTCDTARDGALPEPPGSIGFRPRSGKDNGEHRRNQHSDATRPDFGNSRQGTAGDSATAGGLA